MLDPAELLGQELEHTWSRTANAKAPSADSSENPNLERAHALARALPPSIEGHGGDHALFDAAAELATVLGDDASAILRVLTETYNPRCVPAWPRRKLEREARVAAERQAKPEAKAAKRRRERAEPFRPAEGVDGDGILVLDTSRQGVPRKTISNVSLVVEHVFGERLRFEQCQQVVMLGDVDDSLGYFPAGEWSDAHTSALVKLCEGLRLEVSASIVDRAVDLHARQYGYHALRDELLALAEGWDGVPRVDQAMATYWRAEDNEASRGVSRVFLLSLAARGLNAGVKVDTCPVLQSPKQGTRKSSSLAALAGDKFFSDSPLPIGDKEAMAQIQGRWLWEFSEADSLSRRERNQVKAFLSQRVDRFRASYAKRAQDYPRTCCFVASTNDDEFLNDSTGARRFLPVRVAVDGLIDVAGIERDRAQLLGEAARRVMGGEQHWPTEAEDLAFEAPRADASEEDAWTDQVREWVVSRAGEEFVMSDLWDEHTGVPVVARAQLDKKNQVRVGGILRALGCEKRRTTSRRFWVAPSG